MGNMVRLFIAMVSLAIVTWPMGSKAFADGPEEEVGIAENTTMSHEYSDISISSEEMELLKKIVAAESQTQSLEGQMAVVETIFNRVLSAEFPDTVYGVLSQTGQFLSWKSRNSIWVLPESSTVAITEVVDKGRTILPSTEYVFFSRGKASYATGYIKIGDHWFGKGK